MMRCQSSMRSSGFTASPTCALPTRRLCRQSCLGTLTRPCWPSPNALQAYWFPTPHELLRGAANRQRTRAQNQVSGGKTPLEENIGGAKDVLELVWICSQALLPGVGPRQDLIQDSMQGGALLAHSRM